MKFIRTSILTLLLTMFALNIYAQSDAVKRAANSIFTLTTFRPDGTILASSHGVFVGKNGEAVSTWSPFVGASRAVVVDINGQQHDVDAIYGANELYDVCKFRVDCTSQPVTLAKKAMKSGDKVWLAEYAMKYLCSNFDVLFTTNLYKNRLQDPQKICCVSYNITIISLYIFRDPAEIPETSAPNCLCIFNINTYVNLICSAALFLPEIQPSMPNDPVNNCPKPRHSYCFAKLSILYLFEHITEVKICSKNHNIFY